MHPNEQNMYRIVRIRALSNLNNYWHSPSINKLLPFLPLSDFQLNDEQYGNQCVNEVYIIIFSSFMWSSIFIGHYTNLNHCSAYQQWYIKFFILLGQLTMGYAAQEAMNIENTKIIPIDTTIS